MNSIAPCCLRLKTLKELYYSLASNWRGHVPSCGYLRPSLTKKETTSNANLVSGMQTLYWRRWHQFYIAKMGVSDYTTYLLQSSFLIPLDLDNLMTSLYSGVRRGLWYSWYDFSMMGNVRPSVHPSRHNFLSILYSCFPKR